MQTRDGQEWNITDKFCTASAVIWSLLKNNKKEGMTPFFFVMCIFGGKATIQNCFSHAILQSHVPVLSALYDIHGGPVFVAAPPLQRRLRALHGLHRSLPGVLRNPQERALRCFRSLPIPMIRLPAAVHGIQALFCGFPTAQYLKVHHRLRLSADPVR